MIFSHRLSVLFLSSAGHPSDHRPSHGAEDESVEGEPLQHAAGGAAAQQIVSSEHFEVSFFFHHLRLLCGVLIRVILLMKRKNENRKIGKWKIEHEFSAAI